MFGSGSRPAMSSALPPNCHSVTFAFTHRAPPQSSALLAPS